MSIRYLEKLAHESLKYFSVIKNIQLFQDWIMLVSGACDPGAGKWLENQVSTNALIIGLILLHISIFMSPKDLGRIFPFDQKTRKIWEGLHVRNFFCLHTSVQCFGN